MENRYLYKGQDITLDIILKIEHVLSLIAERSQKDFDAAYADFLRSKTYNTLQRASTLLWAESSEFIFDEYLREQTSR